MKIPHVWSLALALPSLPAISFAQTTTRVDLAASGTPGGWAAWPWLSSDGRYAAFTSNAALEFDDSNGGDDVYVRDRQLGTVERVSVNSTGVQGNWPSYRPVISGDGRSVAFLSIATNLVPGDTYDLLDLFVRDLQAGATELVTQSTAGDLSNGEVSDFAISADGRFVVFTSRATDLVPGDTNGAADVFLRDRLNGTTERVSATASSGDEGDCNSASISADGRYVAFASFSRDLVSGDTNSQCDVFVLDRQLGTMELASVGPLAVQGNDASFGCSLSSDGRYVVFLSRATNLVPGDTNGFADAFLHDRQTGATERVSLAYDGAQPNKESTGRPSVSDDGRYIVFESTAGNLLPVTQVNTINDVFIRDREAATTEQISVDFAGAPSPDGAGQASAITGDGRFVAFISSSHLVPDDTDIKYDAFLRDRSGGTSFTSLCDPGSGGVIGCPCSNPPSGPGRGCDNSAATGGAVLAASGATFLSSDNLVFTSSGEKPTATSVVLQGTSSPAAGAVYGQGVRCVGGTLKRLFTKTASGGSITAPSFASGDATVSARSAAKGNPISAGQSRWYLVFYRDPIVLGGCPAGSTFNATQTAVVSWSP